MAKKNHAPAPAPTNQKPSICRYCGKPEAFGSAFCSKECQDAYEAAMKRDQPQMKLFNIGTIAGILVMLYGAFMNVTEATGLGAIIVGMTFIFIPLTTPGLIKSMGYRRARVTGRITGIIMLILGIWVGWF